MLNALINFVKDPPNCIKEFIMNWFNIILVVVFTIILVMSDFKILYFNYLLLFIVIVFVVFRILTVFAWQDDKALKRYDKIKDNNDNKIELKDILANRIYVALNSCITNRYHILIGFFAYLAFLFIYSDKVGFLLTPEYKVIASIFWIFIALHNLLNYIGNASAIHYIEGSYEQATNNSDKYKYEWKYATNELFFFAIFVCLTVIFTLSPFDTANSQMVKTTIIIPQIYNDNSQIPEKLIQKMESEILNISDGFTVFEAKGKWLNKVKDLSEDQNFVYVISISPDKLDDLEKLVQKYKKKFKQEKIYFDHHPVTHKDI